jgi:sterol desaturase/sphingolipid hydroxylase (fatty acid hydroxylase superfamily)
MPDWAASDVVARTGVFALVALTLAALESWPASRARAVQARTTRAVRHLVLAALGTVAGRLAVPAGLAGVAIWAQAQGVGVLPALGVTGAVGFAVTLVALDLAIYAQHRAMHAHPWLWCLHRVHHCDTAMDLTTGVRFHPLEIAVSLLWKALVVLALGAPPEAVLAYEALLSALALFTHANIALPRGLDRWLRHAIATPAFHLVHHSPRKPETDSNFANALTVWDRLFGTWRDAVAPPDPGVGLEHFREPKQSTLAALLLQPWARR